jgi:DNA repair exonuclease SbcCD ATPase subunit
MKNAGLLAIMASIIVAAFSLNGYAMDVSSQISTLEKQAQRIQSQIDQATQTSSTALDQQVKVLEATIDSLVKKKVQIDAQISAIEGQIDKLRTSSQAVLQRQMEQYNKELATVKQQISGLMSQKALNPASSGAAATQPAALQPLKPAVPSPAAAPAKPCPKCPAEKVTEAQPAGKVGPDVSANLTEKVAGIPNPSAAQAAPGKPVAQSPDAAMTTTK